MTRFKKHVNDEFKIKEITELSVRNLSERINKFLNILYEYRDLESKLLLLTNPTEEQVNNVEFEENYFEIVRQSFMSINISG